MKKKHFFSTMVITEIFGRSIHVATSRAGFESDKMVYMEFKIRCKLHCICQKASAV